MMSLWGLPGRMEQGTGRRVEPAEFGKQSRLVGYAGLAGDVVVATVFLGLRPFEQMINYVLAAAIVASGIVLLYVFAVRFPRNYERNYARMYEPKPK